MENRRPSHTDACTPAAGHEPPLGRAPPPPVAHSTAGQRIFVRQIAAYSAPGVELSGRCRAMLAHRIVGGAKGRAAMDKVDLMDLMDLMDKSEQSGLWPRLPSSILSIMSTLSIRSIRSTLSMAARRFAPLTPQPRKLLFYQGFHSGDGLTKWGNFGLGWLIFSAWVSVASKDAREEYGVSRQGLGRHSGRKARRHCCPGLADEEMSGKVSSFRPAARLGGCSSAVHVGCALNNILRQGSVRVRCGNAAFWDSTRSTNPLKFSGLAGYQQPTRAAPSAKSPDPFGPGMNRHSRTARPRGSWAVSYGRTQMTRVTMFCVIGGALAFGLAAASTEASPVPPTMLHPPANSPVTPLLEMEPGDHNYFDAGFVLGAPDQSSPQLHLWNILHKGRNHPPPKKPPNTAARQACVNACSQGRRACIPRTTMNRRYWVSLCVDRMRVCLRRCGPR